MLRSLASRRNLPRNKRLNPANPLFVYMLQDFQLIRNINLFGWTYCNWTIHLHVAAFNRFRSSVSERWSCGSLLSSSGIRCGESALILETDHRLFVPPVGCCALWRYTSSFPNNEVNHAKTFGNSPIAWGPKCLAWNRKSADYITLLPDRNCDAVFPFLIPNDLHLANSSSMQMRNCVTRRTLEPPPFLPI